METVEEGRLTRAARAVLDGSAGVEEVGPDTYAVSSFSSTGTYRVQLERERCTCPDSAFRNRRCKHVAAALLHRRAISLGR